MIIWVKSSVASILLSAALLGAPAVFAQEPGINCDNNTVDDDGDGLIELCTLESLNAVRHVLDGSGYKVSASAAKNTAGCPGNVCRGYEMVRDLDFNKDSDYDNAANKVKWTTTSTGGWSPIGDKDNRFSGTFDGNGYTLSGLTIHTTANEIALFGALSSSGTITAISLSEVNVSGYRRVSGLVGWNYGTITNSYSRGQVNGYRQMGGLVGWNDGTISNSYSSGLVIGSGWVGGLVGNNIDGIITHSSSTAHVEGDVSQIGGLAARNGGTITYSYSSGSVSATAVNVGGLVGLNYGAITNSYSLGVTSGKAFVGGLVGVNDSGGVIINSYNSGLASASGSELREVLVGGLVGYNNGGTIINSYNSRMVNGKRGFDFVGGLSAYNNGGTIINSYNSGPVSGEYLGGLVGVNTFGGTIIDSYNKGPVSGDDHAGGLAADNHGLIINSHNSGSVNGRSARVGGLVGWNGTKGKIFNSYSSRTVTGLNLDVGGLVGMNEGAISNSYSKAQVRGTSNKVGGLVGNHLQGTISNSYSTGLVTGRSNVGGLVGVNESVINNSYSTGLVTGSNNVGGLVGQGASGTTVTHSYWDITTSEQLRSAGGTSKTTAQLQAPTTASGIYSEWSEDDWYFGTRTEYPALKHTTGTDANNVACGIEQRPACDSLLAGQGRALVVLSAQTLVHAAAMEGDIIVLKAAPGHSILGTTQTERRFAVPPDFVGREATTAAQTYQVGVNDGTNTHQITVLVLVEKVNNGRSVWSIRQNGNDLTVSLLADPDGVADVSSVSYQWQKCLVGDDCSREISWRDVGSTASSYSVVAAERKRNNLFRVIVRYRDGQGYAEEGAVSVVYSISSVSSAPTFTRDWSQFAGGAAAVCNDADIDNDNDGLIEICHLEDLDAIRHAPDGSGYQPYNDVAKSTLGCGAGGCKGYELVRDLDFAADNSYLSTANRVRWTTGTGWLPISPGLSGTFDGNGYTLSGLMIDRGDRESFADRVGLFASLSSRGVIEEIGLLNTEVRGRNWVGGLVGENNSGTISNSYSRGSVSGNWRVGGLVGENDNGTISNSHSRGTVNGSWWVGGLVGVNEKGTISNSDSSGSVSSEARYVGGLVGQNIRGHISKSHSSGSVRGSQWVGILVGENYEGTVSHSYSTGQVRGRWNAGGLAGKNIRGDITNSYSSGSVSSSYQVGGLVGENWGTISNSYSRGSASGNWYVGGLVGSNYSIISNSYSSAPASGDNQYMGGLVGLNHGTISNSYSSGTARGNYQVGGLVGTNYGVISSSYSSGEARGWSGSIGGLVGRNRGIINNSYSRGFTVCDGQFAGGLVGWNGKEGRIFNSYSSSPVKGVWQAGGLVGLNNGMISNSYSIGQVSGRTDVGGLIGANNGTLWVHGLVKDGANQGTVYHSYWDITASRLLTSDGGTSKTIVELQTPTNSTGIYSTWSSDIWDFGTAIQYPALKYTTGTDANNLLCGIEGQPPCGSLIAGVEQRIRHIVISTATVRAQAVEGETVVLNAPIGNWTYQWDIPGNVRTLSTTDTAELRVVVPTDLVEREATTDMLTFELTISTGTASTEYNIEIVVIKAENGTMNPTISISKNTLTQMGTDPDGDVMIEVYQWQRCLGSSATVVCSNEDSWEDVSTSTSYSLSAEDAVVGNRFRVRLTYTDGQGYRATVISATFTYSELVVPRRAIFVRLKLFLEGALQ